MRQKSGPHVMSAEQVVKDIRRATRKQEPLFKLKLCQVAI
jgi:hypothetical protein